MQNGNFNNGNGNGNGRRAPYGNRRPVYQRRYNTAPQLAQQVAPQQPVPVAPQAVVQQPAPVAVVQQPAPQAVVHQPAPVAPPPGMGVPSAPATESTLLAILNELRVLNNTVAESDRAARNQRGELLRAIRAADLEQRAVLAGAKTELESLGKNLAEVVAYVDDIHVDVHDIYNGFAHEK